MCADFEVQSNHHRRAPEGKLCNMSIRLPAVRLLLSATLTLPNGVVFRASEMRVCLPISLPVHALGCLAHA